MTALQRMEPSDLPSAARALVTGTLPADHDKLREAIDLLSRAAHTPATTVADHERTRAPVEEHHCTCWCNDDVALCGTVVAGFEWAEGEFTCAVCADLEGHPCALCGEL